jgi:hypothetical protein
MTERGKRGRGGGGLLARVRAGEGHRHVAAWAGTGTREGVAARH